jgi:hypothetical protein
VRLGVVSAVRDLPAAAAAIFHLFGQEVALERQPRDQRSIEAMLVSSWRAPAALSGLDLEDQRRGSDTARARRA